MPQAREQLQATLAELRQAISAKAGPDQGQGELPLAGATTTATGWPQVDAMLGGGLPRGRLTELVGARSSGKATLALAAVARATRTGQLVAWVDGPGELYPPVAAAEGVDLERLLMVRSGGTTGGVGLAAARAGEIVARSRAFGLVVLDLPERASFPDRAASRLRAAAHETGIAVVALTSRRGALPHAHCQLDVSTDARAAGDAASLRRFVVTLVRGGVQPGAQAAVAHGAPSLASFRDPASPLAAELTAAADAIRPMPWRADSRRTR
jgi:hypothetical protein